LHRALFYHRMTGTMKTKMYFIFAFLLVSVCSCPDNAKRIVSLGPAITEELYLLGVGEDIVGDTVYCVRPESATDIEKVGNVMEINVEKIVSLKPDAVIATNLTNQRQVEKLKYLGIKVYKIGLAKNFEEICEQFLFLAEMVGKQKEASGIVNDAAKKVNSVKEKRAIIPKQKVFVQVGANPLFTISSDSFVNDYITSAGGINIASDSGAGYFSKEEVLKRNPDIIFIVGMGVEADGEKKMWEEYKDLNAAKNNKIYIFDSYKMCSPTPKSFAEMLEEISEVIS